MFLGFARLVGRLPNRDRYSKQKDLKNLGTYKISVRGVIGVVAGGDLSINGWSSCRSAVLGRRDLPVYIVHKAKGAIYSSQPVTINCSLNVPSDLQRF